MPADVNTVALREAVGSFNSKDDRERYFALYAEDALFHGYAPEDLHGTAAIRQFYDMVWSAFPDIHLSVEDVVADGDRVAARYQISGTHDGEFMGIPTTGKPIAVNGMTIFRFADGKVVERWQFLDTMAMMTQLGALPGPA
ncbi:MAG: ester cyclase [Thermomicrobiales bacterium]